MRHKILFVDDNRALREDFPVWFREYDVRCASSAEEALPLLERANDFDLVIMDVYLPGMDGLKALERIKKSSPDTPVIIMTGFSSKDIAVHAITAKADNYLEKPFDIKTARGVIERELARSRGCDHPEDMGITAKIEHVRGFIEGNCFRKISLKDAAEAVFLTPKYLSKVFREHTGMGFSDYKIKVKMDQAKKMLNTSGLTLKQISSKLGYANTESFIRQFERLEKTTPSCYRERSVAGRRCRPSRRGPRG